MRTLKTMLVVIALAISAMAAERGVLIRETNLYISPDSTSQKLVTAERGREFALLDKTNGWLHIIVEITQQPPLDSRTITGWIVDKGAIFKSTPNGDQIIYGEAVDSETQASQSHGRRGAAGDARRLYYRVYDYFPQSPLAGEALYRFADIQWQLDKEDIDTRKSRRSLDPVERPQIEEENMKLVEKKFPHTKWADLAVYHRMENKLCSDWQAQAKCPEKETEYFIKYAEEHPESPRAAEALYNAAYRFAALIELYKSEGNQKKSEEVRPKAIAIAQKVITKNTSADWNTRAQRLIYMVQNDLPVYGNAVE
jgi:hypothetical protein